MLCYKLRAKQTKFKLPYARKYKKSFKTDNIYLFYQMTTIFNYNQFNTIIYTKKFYVPSCVKNTASLTRYMRESSKKALKRINSKLNT